jgi:spermidine/putrescine-binding protein
MSVQRFFIKEFLSEHGSTLTKERYDNWAALYNVLDDGARALYEMHEIRNEALILAHQLQRENDMLRSRLVGMISSPDP